MSRLTGSEAKSLKEAYNAVYASKEEVVQESAEDLNEAPMTAFQAAGGQARLDQLNRGRSPRSGRVTPAQLERKGQEILYKAGGGDAAVRQGPTRAQNVRGGGQVQVPTLSRQDIINRGAVAAAPAARPAAPAARPAAPAARPAAPAATAPKVTPAAPTPAKPAATPAAPTAPAAAPQRTFNPLMQRTFGYQTGNAPDQIAKASQGSSQAAADAAFKRSREMVNKMRSAATISQSFDPFDVIKGHLLDEGYAETEEAAIAIMAHMGEGWKQSILEGNLGGSAPNLPSGVVKFVDELPANIQKMTQSATTPKAKPGTAQSTRMYGRY